MDAKHIGRRIKAIDFFDKMNGINTISDKDFELAFEYYRTKMKLKQSVSSIRSKSLLKRIDDMVKAAHNIKEEGDENYKFLESNGFKFGIEDTNKQFDKILNKYYNKYKSIEAEDKEKADKNDIVFEDLLANLSSSLSMVLTTDISLSSYISYSLIVKRQSNG